MAFSTNHFTDVSILVLDLQRMDAGRFESSPAPFPFHVMIRSMLGSVSVAAAAKRLQLVVELDDGIDQCDPKRKRSGNVDGEPEGVWVVGDALRLRQVLSNLTSNAVKFTPEDGGAITVKTRLIRSATPTVSQRGTSHSHTQSDSKSPLGRSGTVSRTSKDTKEKLQPMEPLKEKLRPNEASKEKDLESGLGIAHDEGGDSDDEEIAVGGQTPLALDTDGNRIIVRIEVTDSGPGIRPSELQQSKLFSP